VKITKYFILEMDIREFLALGIDSILFGICCRLYIKQCNAIKGLQVCSSASATFNIYFWHKSTIQAEENEE